MYITYNIIYMGAAREPARGGCAHGSSHVVALLLEWAAAERPLGTSVLHNFGRPSFPFHPFPFTTETQANNLPEYLQILYPRRGPGHLRPRGIREVFRIFEACSETCHSAFVASGLASIKWVWSLRVYRGC